MNILLILPKIDLNNEINYNYTFPIGLPYISSILKKAGHNVVCLNHNHREGSVEKILREEFKFKIEPWYKDFMMCRHCGMRYNVCKPI